MTVEEGRQRVEGPARAGRHGALRPAPEVDGARRRLRDRRAARGRRARAAVPARRRGLDEPHEAPVLDDADDRTEIAVHGYQRSSNPSISSSARASKARAGAPVPRDGSIAAALSGSRARRRASSRAASPSIGPRRAAAIRESVIIGPGWDRGGQSSTCLATGSRRRSTSRPGVLEVEVVVDAAVALDDELVGDDRAEDVGHDLHEALGRVDGADEWLRREEHAPELCEHHAQVGGIVAERTELRVAVLLEVPADVDRHRTVRLVDQDLAVGGEPEVLHHDRGRPGDLERAVARQGQAVDGRERFGTVVDADVGDRGQRRYVDLRQQDLLLGRSAGAEDARVDAACHAAGAGGRVEHVGVRVGMFPLDATGAIACAVLPVGVLGRVGAEARIFEGRVAVHRDRVTPEDQGSRAHRRAHAAGVPCSPSCGHRWIGPRAEAGRPPSTRPPSPR